MNIFEESKSIIILLFITLVKPVCVHASTNTGDAKREVKVAVHEYPPFYDRTGKGLLVDLYRAAFGVVNLEVKFQVLPLGRAIQYFKLGKIDALSPGELILPSINKNSILSVNALKVTMCWICLLYTSPSPRDS